MAGTFTHWMIIEDSLDKINSSSGNLHDYFFDILGRHSFVRLGAVSPDYPYLTHAIKSKYIKCHSWADRMHYENTGYIIQCGIEYLIKLDNTSEDFKVCLSWLCGYVSHVIADCIVHPVVNAVVGPYIFNSDEHRKCEMTQDSIIFKSIKGEELYEVATAESGYAGYIDHLKACSDNNNGNRLNPILGKYWKDVLELNYPDGAERFHEIDPDEWHKKYLAGITSASDPSPFFRHIGDELDLIYLKTDVIKSDDRKKYFDKINLPHGKQGSFKEDVFDKAVNKVISTWKDLFIDVEKCSPQNSTAYIKNWNLDTGVDEDDQSLWREETRV